MIGAIEEHARRTPTMPAAVFRSRAPRARPMTAATVRYSDAPTTVRSTPGSASEIADAAPGRLDRRRRRRIRPRAASRVTGSTSPASTISLAHSTGSRRWHHGQRRADHPGSVFAAEHQHAEHADHQLGEQDAEQADRHGVDGRIAPPRPGTAFPPATRAPDADDQR